MESKELTEWTGKKSLKRPEKPVSENIVWKILFFYLTAFIVFSLFSLSHAGAPPPGWRQVNEDGFISGLGPNGETNLFVFDEDLYAFNKNGFFRMNNPIRKNWTKLTPPAPPSGPGPTPDKLIVLGDYLYARYNGELWWVHGNDPNGPNWHKVTSMPVNPSPMTIFAGSIYGVRYTPWDTFQIWRTPHIGLSVAVWQCVAEDSFGDSANNQSVDSMTVFNGHIYAGVGTLNGMFGNPMDYGTGVEIWESPTGSANTWSQVNADGFGTLFQGCINPGTPSQVCNFPIHQVIGSAAVYQAAGETHKYLYIGTKSHFGAEIWRYDGSGANGWTNVTPPWAGPCLFGCGPGRNEDMRDFNGQLYLAEGFPTANLAKYNGSNWSIVVDGPEFAGLPHTFAPHISRLSSLAVHKGSVYVSAAGNSSGTQGDQVWGYPFKDFIAPVYLLLLLN